MVVEKEQVTAWNPDILFINQEGPTLGILKSDFETNPDFYRELSAVQHGQVYGQMAYNCVYTNIELSLVNTYFAATVFYPEQFADVDFDAFARLLEQARQQFSYVFLDAPAGIEAGFSLAAQYADRVILVTNSDPASIRDAAQAGNVLEQMGKTNIRLVVNRIHKRTIETMGLTVDDIMDRAGLPLLGIVPEDVNVVLAAAKNQPLIRTARGGAAAACRRIAKRITGQVVPVRL
jgi:MinD-like ATPase involved in chromosome partitioning or flagellar assembly